MKEKIKPKLFTVMKGYNGKQFANDVVAGLIVAIIALPLSIALALASGVGPEEGLYTAIVAGFIISFLGGSRVQIAGPTAAFASIVAGIVAKNGMSGLMLATIMAGIFLILMGIFRLGSLIKFIPYTIVTGFTAGIAVTIVIGQLKDFFGITYAEGVRPIETIDKIKCFGEYFSSFHWEALLVGVVCMVILIVWPFISKKIPGSLIAILAAIGMVKGFNLDVYTIGDLYTINASLPTVHVPEFSFAAIQTVLPDAFTIAILAAIESLLSAVVADGMINSHHRSNTELIAQGLGNIGSAFFGGIPATGAIARTAANIKNGGRTPVAGMVHAVILLLVLVLFMPYAALIPMPAIAAILFMVAYNMCQWRPFVHLCKTAPKSDILVLVVTFVLTVVFDLVVAIEIGMVIACLLFMKRMSDEANVKSWKYVDIDEVDDEDDPDSLSLRQIAKEIRVYEFSGPLFFGVSDMISQVTTKDFTKCMIFRMRSVPALDATAIRSLEQLCDDCMEKGISVVFSHVNEQPMGVFKKAGLYDKVGAENFCDHIDAALERANEIIK